MSKVEQEFLALPWREVHEGVSVKLLNQNAELLVLAKSADRANKERAMRRRKLSAFFQGLLRSNLTGEKPEVLWERYVQLTEVEAAFKALKSDLAIRPIHHQLEKRVEAHIFVAFLAYCLLTTLRKRLQIYAPGLTPRQVLEKLGRIQMLDVCLPTSDGRWLIMPRYTQPEAEQEMVLEKLNLELPAQPPPRIRSNGTLIAPGKT